MLYCYATTATSGHSTLCSIIFFPESNDHVAEVNGAAAAAIDEDLFDDEDLDELDENLENLEI